MFFYHYYFTKKMQCFALMVCNYFTCILKWLHNCFSFSQKFLLSLLIVFQSEQSGWSVHTWCVEFFSVLMWYSSNYLCWNVSSLAICWQRNIYTVLRTSHMMWNYDKMSQNIAVNLCTISVDNTEISKDSTKSNEIQVQAWNF